MPAVRKIGSGNGQGKPTANDYEQLRSLVLGDDYEEVLRERIEENDVERVSAVITEAVEARNKKDGSLRNHLAPIIESSIDKSIQDNRSRFAEVIYPTIGPAVRKAVAAAFSDMVESLNQLLKESLSIKSVLWRFRAWQAGIAYSEYVILKSIHYRVEQAFLIHRKTGLLIDSCVAKNSSTQDPDLISAMLTAIADFVADSFNQSDENSDLQSIHYGDWTLLVESGPLAVTAVAVRGVLTPEISDRLQTINEKIHKLYSRELQTFSGADSVGIDCEPILRDALLEKYVEQKKSFPWLSSTLLAAMALYVVYLVGTSIHLNILENKLITALEKQPGYVLIDHQRTGKQLQISVIRSPTAVSVEQLKASLATPPLVLKLQSVVASIADPALFLPTLQQKYQLEFSYRSIADGYELIAAGSIERDKVDALLQDPLYSNLFSSFDDSAVIYTVPSVQRELYQQEFLALVSAVNSENIYFESASTTISAASKQTLDSLISQLERLQELQNDSGQLIQQISIIGFADRQGSDGVNASLSKDRARLVASILADNGIDERVIVTWGMGFGDRASVPLEQQRRVSVNVLSSPLTE